MCSRGAGASFRLVAHGENGDRVIVSDLVQSYVIKDTARNDEETARAFPSHSREAHQRAAVGSEPEATYGTKDPAERDAETIIIEQALAILDMRMFQHGEALKSPRIPRPI